MKQLTALWVDDEWPLPSEASYDSRPLILEGYRTEILSALSRSGIEAAIETRSGLDVANDLASRTYDILILDYELVAGSARPGDNALGLLGKLSKALRHVPPAVLFTRHTHAVQALAGQQPEVLGSVLGVFERSEFGLQRLIDRIVQFALGPPLKFLVLSDLHIGYLAESGGIATGGYLDSLVDDLTTVFGKGTIHAVLVPGDLAWRKQAEDFGAADAWIRRIMAALGLSRPEQFHFCPGNHDVDLSVGAQPWQKYRDFVYQLSAGGESFARRFAAYDTRGRRLNAFAERDSVLAVEHDDVTGVVVAALNSCVTGNEKGGVRSSIGSEQWSRLERMLAPLPPQFRVCLMHHPLFSAPGGTHPDERGIADQGTALHMFLKLGVRLVVHGHSHFSAVHQFATSVLNRAGSPERASRLNKLVIVSCPTAVAWPSASSPQRQYMVIDVGGAGMSTEGRTLSVSTRVFDPTDTSWHDGSQLPIGEVLIGDRTP